MTVRWRPSIRRSGPHREGERGTTLIELMVVIFLLILVFGVTTATFVGGVRSSTQVSATTDQTLDLKNAMDRMTETLTAAMNLPAPPDNAYSGFELADANEVRFYANLKNYNFTSDSYGGPVKIDYSLTTNADGSDNLVEKTWSPTAVTNPASDTPNWSYGALDSPTTTHVLVRELVAPTNRNTFTYLASGDASTAGDGLPVSSLPSPTASLQLGVGVNGNLSAKGKTSQAAAVEIYLAVQSGKHPDVVAGYLQTRVTLPNADAVGLPVVASPSAVATSAPAATTSSAAPSASTSASKSASASASAVASATVAASASPSKTPSASASASATKSASPSASASATKSASASASASATKASASPSATTGRPDPS